MRPTSVCPGAPRLSTGDDYEAHIADLHRRGLLDDVACAGRTRPRPSTPPPYLFLVTDLAAGSPGQVLAAAGGFLGASRAGGRARHLGTTTSTAVHPAEIAGLLAG